MKNVMGKMVCYFHTTQINVNKFTNMVYFSAVLRWNHRPNGFLKDRDAFKLGRVAAWLLVCGCSLGVCPLKGQAENRVKSQQIPTIPPAAVVSKGLSVAM